MPVRVLVLCTANSARSQIGEAVLRARGGRRIEVESAGTAPAAAINPGALRVLAKHGVPASESDPKGIDDVIDRRWDVVITVCDHAKETCPVLPGSPSNVHWGVEDPAGAPNEAEAFQAAFEILAGRVDRFLAIPLEDLPSEDVVKLAREIGEVGG